MNNEKLSMKLNLFPQKITKEWKTRTITPDDAEILGRLTWDSFRGTVDDEGETLDEAVKEIEETIEGRYGPFIQEASFIIEEEGKALSATLVTHYKNDRPLLAFIMTHPDAQKTGMGKFLLKKTINRLIDLKHEILTLGVSKKNHRAISLYKQSGFKIY